MMTDGYVKTVGDLRKALEDYDDEDFIEIWNDELIRFGILTSVVRNNCDPHSAHWCARLETHLHKGARDVD